MEENEIVEEALENWHQSEHEIEAFSTTYHNVKPVRMLGKNVDVALLTPQITTVTTATIHPSLPCLRKDPVLAKFI